MSGAPQNSMMQSSAGPHNPPVRSVFHLSVSPSTVMVSSPRDALSRRYDGTRPVGVVSRRVVHTEDAEAVVREGAREGVPVPMPVAPREAIDDPRLGRSRRDQDRAEPDGAGGGR